MSLRKEPSYQKECVLYQCTSRNNTNDDEEPCDRIWISSHSWRQCRKYCRECKTEGVPIDILDRELDLDNFKCQSCGSFWQAVRDPKDKNKKSVQRQQCKCGKSVSAKANDGEKRYCRHYWWKCPKVECGQYWDAVSFDREFAQLCLWCKSPGVIIELERPPRRQSGPHEVKHCEMCMYLIRNGNRNGCPKAKKVEYSVNRVQGVGGSTNPMSKLQVIERLDWIKYYKKKA
ncbi:unnamed protein product [Orchesella dallaii]|uniref:Zinc-binding domain-containing protein n=1 Tax=Orchesella dallaii TaxID=48710 RepID=A0ABP1PPJ7_9HEXA